MSELEISSEVERIRSIETGFLSEPGSIVSEKGEILDDKLFVAVGKDVKDNESTVIWALKNSGRRKICLIHVHTPAQLYPIFGGQLPMSRVGEQEAKLYHERERKEALKALDEYIQLCAKAGVNAHKIFLEAKSIETGIIAHIKQNRIGRLVMGAAGDDKYKKSMKKLMSKKAIYVKAQAPDFCHILFICKGSLVCTRKGVKPPCPNLATGKPNFSKPQLKTAVPNSVCDTDQQKYKPISYGVGGDKDDAADLREEAYPESKHRKTVNEVIDLIRKANGIESLYHEELKLRRELEEKLAKVVGELEIIKNVHAYHIKEHNGILRSKLFLETENAKLNALVEELDEKIFSAAGLLEKYKKQQEDMETERNNALYEAESLRKQHDLLGSKTAQICRLVEDYTFLEIAQATNNFNLSKIISEGGLGSIYKGFLHHTEVAIKLLNPESMQGHQDFKQEVDTLSKLHHPNIVTLIGICSEASALVYEYLPNGSLEDRLACKDNTPPLSWQTRIQIAAELCSVLMFLHSLQPQCIIHGNLKPGNILLDAHLSCKLSDFGIFLSIANGQSSIDIATRLYTTDPEGAFAYIDPEFILTGELTSTSDVYSFGIILLRLLTGKSALGIPKEVQNALDEGNLHDLLDPSAGNWPFVQAKQLALLALRCCEMRSKERPELVGDVWRVIEPMRLSCGSSSSPRMVGNEHDHVPSYFICPIFKEVMENPQIAADGYTYEAEALRCWLDSGHDTSPMTNLKLTNRTLVPNRALRSAIQEWLQHKRRTK